MLAKLEPYTKTINLVSLVLAAVLTLTALGVHFFTTKEFAPLTMIILYSALVVSAGLSIPITYVKEVESYVQPPTSRLLEELRTGKVNSYEVLGALRLAGIAIPEVEKTLIPKVKQDVLDARTAETTHKPADIIQILSDAKQTVDAATQILAGGEPHPLSGLTETLDAHTQALTSHAVVLNTAMDSISALVDELKPPVALPQDDALKATAKSMAETIVQKVDKLVAKSTLPEAKPVYALAGILVTDENANTPTPQPAKFQPVL